MALLHEGPHAQIDLSPFTVSNVTYSFYIFLYGTITVFPRSRKTLIDTNCVSFQADRYTEELKKWEGKHHVDLVCELRLRQALMIIPAETFQEIDFQQI